MSIMTRYGLCGPRRQAKNDPHSRPVMPGEARVTAHGFDRMARGGQRAHEGMMARLIVKALCVLALALTVAACTPIPCSGGPCQNGGGAGFY
jgi:hypothetical protein